MPRFELLFDDIRDGAGFIRDLTANRRARTAKPPTGDTWSFSNLDFALRSNGGFRSRRSFFGKEDFIYSYQERVTQQDLEYLHKADPTAKQIIERPPAKVWNAFPFTSSPNIDGWLKDLMFRRVHSDVRAAHELARRDGSAFIYHDVSGDASEPIGRDTGKYFGAQAIPIQLVDDAEETSDVDELLFHGYESVKLDLEERDEDEEDFRRVEEEIHGHRLTFITQDDRNTGLRRRSSIEPIFDALQNYRDIEWSLKRNQFEGNPLQMTIDTENFELDPETEQTIQTDITEFVEAGSQAFSPIEGVEIDRVGAPDMDDPAGAVETAASRIANGTELPVNMILASTRGSDRISDQDVRQFWSNVRDLRLDLGTHIVKQLVEIGKWIREVPATDPIPHPTSWHWQDLRPLTARDRAYVAEHAALAAKAADAMGRDAPPWVERMYPDNPNKEPSDTTVTMHELQESLEEMRNEQQQQ